MSEKYKIRKANQSDKDKIYHWLKTAIANQMSLIDPEMVPKAFIKNYMELLFENEDFIIIENKLSEIEMIGQFYEFQNGNTSFINGIKELKLINANTNKQLEDNQELFIWLVKEINEKHSDIFQIEFTAPVSHKQIIESFKNIGFAIKGKYSNRIENLDGSFHTHIPLTWFNPSFLSKTA